jgi:hypothetical protein
MFALLASRYGWTPEQTSHATIAQLYFYADVGTGAEKVNGGMNRAQAIALARWKQKQHEAALATLEEALFDES